MEITVKGLHFSYNGKSVLEGISLTIQEGEILAIVGPNGSGKTTLLKNISGILAPDAGAVYLDMKRIADLSSREIARHLAAVEQEREVGFDFTVREIVAMGRLPYRGRFARESKRDQELIRRAMQLTKVTPFADRSIQEVSGGERQRVFLAMALAQEPRVLLLDEPTAHLDINYQIEIMEIIREQATTGLSVVMAIHDLNLAAHYADQVALLHQRRLLGAGTPEEVLTEADLKRAFHADVVVERNPLTNSLHINAVPQRIKKRRLPSFEG